MTWPGFPKRLQSALKALGCLAEAGSEMQAPAIASRIDVPKAETAKILQLLVWGGFVTSRRGTKGGFHLAAPPDVITMGEVIDFFLSRHPEEPDRISPVMRALKDAMSEAQEKFARLTLAEVVKFRGPGSRGKRRPSSVTPQGRQKAPKVQFPSIRKAKKRSRPNA
jgi:Rrf2 family protein